MRIGSELAGLLGSRYGAVVHASCVLDHERVRLAKRRLRRDVKLLEYCAGRLQAARTMNESVPLLDLEAFRSINSHGTAAAGGGGEVADDPPFSPAPSLALRVLQRLGFRRDARYWRTRLRETELAIERDSVIATDPLQPTGVAFVTFFSPISARLCLAEHAQFGSLWHYRARPTLHGRRLGVDEPDEAEDIVWDNLRFGVASRIARQLVSLTCVLTFEVVAAGVIYFLLNFRAKHTGNAGAIWTGLIVTIINTAMRAAINLFSRYERLHTKSAHVASRLSKVLVFEVCTVGLTIALNFHVNMIWEETVGAWAMRILPLFASIVSLETAQRVAVVLVNPVWRLKRWFARMRPHLVPRREAELLEEGPSFDEVFAYASMLRVLLFACVISPVFPLAWPIVGLATGLTFVTSRYMLLSHCVLPVRGDFRLGPTLRRVLLLAAICHCLSSIIIFFCAGPKEYKSLSGLKIALEQKIWRFELVRAIYPPLIVALVAYLTFTLYLMVRLFQLGIRLVFVAVHILFCLWVCMPFPGTKDLVDEIRRSALGGVYILDPVRDKEAAFEYRLEGPFEVSNMKE